MKQELIDAFMLKNSGKFTPEQQMNLHKLLKTTSDEAFTILMTLKISANPITKVVLYLLGVFGLVMFVTGIVHAVVTNIEFIAMAIAGLTITLIGFICANKPSKKKRYQEYSKIALAYQIKD